MNRILCTLGWLIHAAACWLAGCGARAEFGGHPFAAQFVTYLFWVLAAIAVACAVLCFCCYDSIEAHKRNQP